MNRPGTVGFVVLIVLTLVAGVSGPIAVADTGHAAPPAAETQPTAIATPPDESQFAIQERQSFDNTTFEIVVHENGSATWTFRYKQRFANEDNATAARENFNEWRTEFETNETDLYEEFTDQSERMVESGQQETGREMEATNFRRTTRIEDQFTATGVVEMSFTWENFALVDGDRIVVGDVFENLPLGPTQTIVIEAGGDLTFQSIEPSDGQYAGSSLEDAASVWWDGPREFIDGRPRAVFDRPGSEDTGLITTIGGIGPGWYLLGALFGLGLAAAAVIWYRRYGPGAGAGEPTDRDSSVEAESPQPAPAPVDAADKSAADADSVTDEELLTDEDRVVKLIRENGGRMKQVNIVEETGWSKSKVSMLLSDMEDDGTISKLRVGRENIISLEGFEPEATKSPFEE
ncbi:helix-turn-helix transcriptional regulator [Haloarchaeobius amylolyticus]|uniref:Helix-turn-helix transcriptional regulator n=1 Tax=Haloarchaeobius amylolyticus TaxID=1198296 RepID=A0ABD6BBH1_9EURY